MVLESRGLPLRRVERDIPQPAPGEILIAIIFAPAGPLVVNALRATRKGGTVVCAGITGAAVLLP